MFYRRHNLEENFEIFFNFLKNEDLNETKNELVESAIGVLTGDNTAPIKFIKVLWSLPTTVKDAIYIEKFRAFLKGVYKEKQDSIKLCEKLFSDDKTKRSNAMRIVQIIDKAENEDCLQFIINATTALLLDLINVDMYYRICMTITDTLYEDLLFLKRNVFKTEAIKGNYSVHGLSRSGLMILAGIDGNADINEQEYFISQFGRDVDHYAISFEDEEHLMRHKKQQI